MMVCKTALRIARLSYYLSCIVVSVSIPAMLSVAEVEGRVEVCATLSASEMTERNFTVSLATSDGEGKLITVAYEYSCTYIRVNIFSIRWF